MLTDRQAHLLAYIRQRIASDGVSPTYADMAEALGVSSKSNIDRLLAGLEERGHIRRFRYRRQAIEVIDPLPADLRPALRETLLDAREVIRLRAYLTPKDRADKIDRIDRLMERLQR